MRRALVTGITGQDGFYLATHLRDQGFEVWGTAHSASQPPELEFVHVVPATNLTDQRALDRVITSVQPDRIYHLAAQSSVAASWEHPVETGDVTGLGATRLLEAVRRFLPTARVFIASSSEIFGEPDSAPQDEQTTVRPVSPYGAAKAYALHIARGYRQRHGLFVACGILYNHESPRRPVSFVTRKITAGAVAIARGKRAELRLGNLDARRDWGYAGDYVKAMHLMLNHDQPDDFVIASGTAHSVRDFCDIAFTRVGLDYRDYVVTDPAFWRPAEATPLEGNSARIRQELGWTPQVSFRALVEMLVDAELDVPSSSSLFGI